jgi:large subunit GTPase 1
LSSKTFEAERGAVIVTTSQLIPQSANSVKTQADLISHFAPTTTTSKYTPLKIPRRPPWTRKMSAQEIETQENHAFLEWRRDIASMEENNVTLAITPFEKNIEMWKQLWRVIEKSDLLLQIVDARNPYFFYCPDLEKYI